MMDKTFWENVRNVWIMQAPPAMHEIRTGSGGPIDPELLNDPWDQEGIPFDMIDYDGAIQAGLTGGEIPLKTGAAAAVLSAHGMTQKTKPARPQLDTETFERHMESKKLPDYVEACRLLKACGLPEQMDRLYGNLIERISVLKESASRFESVYHADLDPFCDYYIPETLQLTASYLEYLSVGIDDQIVKETEKEIMEAGDKLLLAVNDKIDEIYRFASLEIKAKAKALESLMSQDGYVNPEYKIK